MKDEMDFPSERVKEACNGHCGFEYDAVKQGGVHYLYWKNSHNEYLAAFSDIDSADKGTYDIRVFRIWQREYDIRDMGATKWQLVTNDFMFGSSMDHPLAMFIDYIEDYEMVECSFPMNEWQFNTLIGNFNK